MNENEIDEAVIEIRKLDTKIMQLIMANSHSPKNCLIALLGVAFRILFVLKYTKEQIHEIIDMISEAEKNEFEKHEKEKNLNQSLSSRMLNGLRGYN